MEASEGFYLQIPQGFKIKGRRNDSKEPPSCSGLLDMDRESLPVGLSLAQGICWCGFSHKVDSASISPLSPCHSYLYFRGKGGDV